MESIRQRRRLYIARLLRKMLPSRIKEDNRREYLPEQVVDVEVAEDLEEYLVGEAGHVLALLLPLHSLLSPLGASAAD